jgi:tetratricopeptide (TPR) repeat protein
MRKNKFTILKKALICWSMLFAFGFQVAAQDWSRVSDKQRTLIEGHLEDLHTAKNDTVKGKVLGHLSFEYRLIDLEQAKKYGKKSIKIARRLKMQQLEAAVLLRLGVLYEAEGKYDEALSHYENSIKVSKEIGHKTIQAANLTSISHIHKKKGDHKTSIKIAEESLEMYEELKDTLAISRVVGNIGNTYLEMGDYKKAIAYCEESSKLKLVLGDSVGLGINYDRIGRAHFSMGNYDAAQNFYIKGLQLVTRQQRYDLQVNAYSHLGEMYNALQNFEKGLEYAKLTLELAEKYGDMNSISRALLGVGNSYQYMAKYSKAIEHYEKQLEIQKELDETESQVLSLLSISKVHMLQQNYELALEYGNKAKKFVDISNTDELRAYFYNHLSEIHFQMETYVKAIEYALNSIEYSTKINAREEKMNSLLVLATSYGKLDEHEEAYNYFERYSMLKDSLLTDSKQMSIVNSQTKYETEKKEKEIALLLNKDSKNKIRIHEQNLRLKSKELELNRSRFMIFGVISAAILTLLIGVVILILFRWRQTKMSNQLRVEALESKQKALTAQMNPHFIFNSLNSIENFIYQNEKRNLNKYLTKFATLMRLILNSSQEVVVPIDQEVQALDLYMELEALRFRDRFSYSISIDDNIDQYEMQIPSMLIQPFVENAIWHGIMHKEGPGKVEVTMKLEGEKVKCTITDDGIGREKAMEIRDRTKPEHESQGLEITRKRLEVVNALTPKEAAFTLTDLEDDLGNATGTKVEFNIPYKHE